MNTMGVLGAVVEVSGNGDRVVIDPFEPMIIAALYLFLLLLPILFILGIVFFRKKYQHQQILVAMEKGIPITDLVAKPAPRDREINWVRSFSAGIGFLVTAGSLWWLWYWTQESSAVSSLPALFLIAPIVVGGLGLIFLLRGILQKICEKKQGVLKEEKEPTLIH